LKEVNTNSRRGGFIDDDSDDEPDATSSNLFHKKPLQAQENVADKTELRDPEPTAMPPTTVRLESFSEKIGASTAQPSDSAYASDTAEQEESQPDLPVPSQPEATTSTKTLLRVQTCHGRGLYIGERRKKAAQSYEQIIAARSVHIDGHAQKSYYGIEVHRLLDENVQEARIKAATQSPTTHIQPSIESRPEVNDSGKTRRTLMWTEKYRARKFTDLVGDERTHRSVLRWLKGWDTIVFPGSSKQKHLLSKKHADQDDERYHRKVLLLTGPPGLGKTTLAHVCAKQAGYEVQEINASDERSKDVVKGRIRDMVGTENVRGHHVQSAAGKTRKAGKPVCVIVDEVDGVVGGAGSGGEGGFIKALIDLVALDERNSKSAASESNGVKRKKKGDKFRMLRPLILICNDVYHPSLRPLRQGSVAETIHMRKPNLAMVIGRVQSIFEKEGVPCDVDGVRRLCEATWGVSTKREGGGGTGTGEGDIRSVMVVGEWVATKLRASAAPSMTVCPRLTRKWIEANILGDLGHGGGAARSLGRGGAREVTERVFQEGAGFPKVNPVTQSAAQVALDQEGVTGVVGAAEASKRRANDLLRQMVDMTGETDRILQDCFTTYPTQPIQDDTFLSKPNAAYEWLHFHDMLSSQLFGSQDWELAPYLSTPVLAFHNLFASTAASRYTHQGKPNGKNDDNEEEKIPFSGPGAPFAAAEALKANNASIASLQGALSLPLARMYRSHADITTELLPYTLRMLAPDVKPVVINTNNASGKSMPTASVRKASEKALVARSVECMAATGVRFDKSRIENESIFNKSTSGGWIYRMEPPLDVLGSFETTGKSGDKGVRYAVRQVLEMEWRKRELKKGEETRIKKMTGVDLHDGINGNGKDAELRRLAGLVKRDFFGRVIIEQLPSNGTEVISGSETNEKGDARDGESRAWVSFNEGFSNAVRKPITLKELMESM
jgi:chromosome transmission fidelity protein 18